MRNVGCIYLSFLTVFFSSCTTAFKEVDIDSPSANLEFVGYDINVHDKFKATQMFRSVEKRTCANQQRLAIFSYRNNFEKQSKRVAADKQFRIISVMGVATSSMTLSTGGTIYNSEFCNSFGSFIPLKGHSYQVSQKGSPLQENCTLEVVDKTTNLPPADLVVETQFECP